MAVLREHSEEWKPEGRGHDLLQTWALYRRGGDRTHSPVTSGSWSERQDVATDAEPVWIVVIDHVIAELVRVNYVYEPIVKRFHLDGLAVWDVADKLHRTEGFVKLSLRGVWALAEERVPEP